MVQKTLLRPRMWLGIQGPGCVVGARDANSSPVEMTMLVWSSGERPCCMLSWACVFLRGWASTDLAGGQGRVKADTASGLDSSRQTLSEFSCPRGVSRSRFDVLVLVWVQETASQSLLVQCRPPINQSSQTDMSANGESPARTRCAPAYQLLQREPAK